MLHDVIRPINWVKGFHMRMSSYYIKKYMRLIWARTFLCASLCFHPVFFMWYPKMCMKISEWKHSYCWDLFWVRLLDLFLRRKMGDLIALLTRRNHWDYTKISFVIFSFLWAAIRARHILINLVSGHIC